MCLKKMTAAVSLLVLLSGLPLKAADVFVLKPELAGKHPRIFFTQEEAAALKARGETDDFSKLDYMLMKNYSTIWKYNATANPDVGQYSWWHATRCALYAGISQDTTYRNIAIDWVKGLLMADWGYTQDASITLYTAHLVGAFAIVYDAVADYLLPTHKQLAQDKLVQSVQMFHTKGYESGITGGSAYWLNDYQNNHMHFRLAASLFTIITLWGEVSADLTMYADNLMKYYRRLDYVLSPDGSNHEGFNYNHYGHAMLTPAVYAFDHCIPKTAKELVNPVYHNVGYMVLYHMTPDWLSCFGYGDSGNGPSDNLAYIYHSASHYRDGYLQQGIAKLRMKQNSKFDETQWCFLFKDGTVPEKNITELPTYRYFEDLGVVSCRANWTDPNATAVLFKCGPMGGQILNLTRGTEYSINTDYINVAHDDPDAGCFLLYSKGNFLSTGDGYEKTAKVSIHHSTMVVDGATQYGAGGGWSQPQVLSRWAWPRDFCASGGLVAYTGNMKGVYPNMTKLDRTFASQRTNYIVIYDDMQSTASRRYDWRMQTPGAATLADQGSATYKVTSGTATALVKKYAPAAGAWTTDAYTANDGNLSLKALRINMTGQTSQRFMVLIAPNAADLTMVTDNYDNATTLGVKVSLGGKTEYTLFGKTSAISAGDVTATAATVLTSEDQAGNTLEYAAVSNGNSFTYKSTRYFASNTKVSIGMDYAAGSGDGGVFTVRASSESDTAGGAQVTIGGLRASTSYPVSVNGTSQGNSTANASGELTVSVGLGGESQITIGSVTGVKDDPLARRPVVAAVSLMNPLVAGSQVRLHLTVAQELDVRLYDSRGGLVTTLSQGLFSAGDYSFSLDHCRSGIYFLKVNGSAYKVMVVP